MRTSAGLLLGAALLAVPATTAVAATPSSDGPGARPYIVTLADDADPRAVADEHRNRHGAEVGHVFRTALRGYAARLSAGEVAEVRADERVTSVSPDRTVTTLAQSTPTGIDRVDAEQSATANIDGTDDRVDVDVAVIDTGIDLDHPDLNVHTAGAINCSTGRDADDGNGHGTHVAGTIGALDNDSGVVGVAPGARVWPVRVLDNRGSGRWSDIICGIDHVTAHADEIEVANMSLGGAGTDDGDCGNTNDDALHQAICNSVAAGVTYAVAAGNDYADAANSVPAAYDEVITVSALADFDGASGGAGVSTCRADQDDTFADFSNYGPDVDLIAPGVCIESTWMKGGYETISGTSMASPHVAGGAALYTANHPGATPAQVRSALQDAGTTDWIWPSEDPDGIQEKLLNVSTF
ncbi:S8 family serine peptidase [Saccharomonospora saliphila]|uniref:S8 family serine peptidase n=1 Tax=Saccharomonospora saliphila TaxID=369829 RepID=UPI0003737221|nr:S8 family serine peptidase [Saccharomonospora saliphila]